MTARPLHEEDDVPAGPSTTATSAPAASAGTDGHELDGGRLDGRRLRWRRVETRAVIAVQRGARVPGTVEVSRALGRAGDHAAAWVVLGVLAGLVDRERRGAWAGGVAAALGAHAATVVLKRVVRRRRPDDPRVVVGATAPSRLSFPSSHAASTTAAALVYGRLLGTRATWPLAVAVGLSRPLLGLHFPGDVAVGTVVGVLADRAHARRWPGRARPGVRHRSAGRP